MPVDRMNGSIVQELISGSLSRRNQQKERPTRERPESPVMSAQDVPQLQQTSGEQPQQPQNATLQDDPKQQQDSYYQNRHQFDQTAPQSLSQDPSFNTLNFNDQAGGEINRTPGQSPNFNQSQPSEPTLNFNQRSEDFGTIDRGDRPGNPTRPWSGGLVSPYSGNSLSLSSGGILFQSPVVSVVYDTPPPGEVVLISYDNFAPSSFQAGTIPDEYYLTGFRVDVVTSVASGGGIQDVHSMGTFSFQMNWPALSRWIISVPGDPATWINGTVPFVVGVTYRHIFDFRAGTWTLESSEGNATVNIDGTLPRPIPQPSTNVHVGQSTPGNNLWAYGSIGDAYSIL